MTTLRDLWIAKGLTSTEVAARARCAVPTLYKMNRRDDAEGTIAIGIVRRVCATIGMTLGEYEQLDVCPHAGDYRPPTRRRGGRGK